jgi:transposase-like protein
VEDYPKNLREFDDRFATQEACRDYLEKLRWPDGFVCPCCSSTKAWKIGLLWECAQCAKQVSVTSGTIFQDTRTDLRVWLQAMWWLTTQKNGASALGLQRVLGLKNYQTAWTWLHKLRSAMVRPGRDLLQGCVEVDETYFGGLEEGKSGRESGKKALIAVAVEESGKGSGRIRVRLVKDASGASLMEFISLSIKEGSVVHTDGWVGYSGLDKHGYKHQITVVKGQKAHELLPRTHRVITLLKRWLLGTHQGAVSHKHLAYYLDEFTFRFNRRSSSSRGKLFYRLVQQALMVEPRTYRMIVDQVATSRQSQRPKTQDIVVT